MRAASLHPIPLVLMLLATLGCTRESQITGPLRGAELIRQVDALAVPIISSGTVLGLSIAVVQGDSVLFARGYGHADLERTVPCDENSVYWIASVTKLFTAATLLRLAEDGLLDLDLSVTHYLPELGGRWDSVTVWHSLNHTSGIPDFVLEGDARAREQGISIDHAFALDWTQRAQPLFPPGSRWTYTNTAFYLAGMIGERVSGEQFDAALTRAIVKPFGLSSTGPGFSDALRGRWRVFRLDGDALVDFRLVNDHPFFTDGYMCSTVLEVAAVLRDLFDGRVLRDESLRRMICRSPTRYGDVGYGLGVRLGTMDGRSKMGHTGGYFGTIAAAAYYPDDSLAVVVLLNTDAGGDAEATDLEAKVARLALGIPAASLDEVPLTAEQIERLSGTFEMISEGQTKRYELYGENGRLMERRLAPAAEPYALRHIGGGTFASPDWGEVRLVASLDGGSIETLIETWGGFFGDIAYRVSGR